MTKSINYTIAGSLVAIAIVFITTSTRSASLEKQVQSLRTKFNAAKTPITIPQNKTPKALTTVTQVQELIEANQSEANPLASMAVLLPAVKMVETCDIDTLLELAKQLAMDSTNSASKLIAMNYMLLAAADDPEHTLAFFEENMTTRVGEDIDQNLVYTEELVLSGILQSLAKSNPEATAYQVKKLPDDPRSRRTKAVVVGALLLDRPDLAIDLFGNDLQLAKAAASSISADPNDVAAAAARLGEISETKMRAAVSIGLLGSAYLNSGYGATLQLYKSLAETDPSARTMIVIGLVNDLAGVSPPQAIAFAESEMSGSDQGRAIADTLSKWARSDFNAAATWLGEQKPSKIRDEAINSFAIEIRSTDPEAAVIWAKEIADSSLRQKTLETLRTGKPQNP